MSILSIDVFMSTKKQKKERESLTLLMQIFFLFKSS
jgi:hypothetical protein